MVNQQPFQLKKQIVKHQNYCLDITLSRINGYKMFAAPMANGDIDIFDLDTLSLLSCIKSSHPDIVLSQCQYDGENSNLLWSSNKSGQLLLHDIRTQNCVLNLNGSKVLTLDTKAILAFDINSSHTEIAAGTELLDRENPANILFWDIRNTGMLLNKFEECHSDDITQIKYHPSESKAMISGSTDGLVCLYNLCNQVEEESLYQVIKDESVSKIGYFGPSYEYIYSLSHMETFSLYKFEDAQKLRSFGDVRISSPEMNLHYCVDCEYDPFSQLLFLVTGSQEGSIGIFDVNMDGFSLIYSLNAGHSDIVRGVQWNVRVNYD
jgi:WD repeat-containing protein 89